MGKIRMPLELCREKNVTFSDIYTLFVTDAEARGLAEKTLLTYRRHLSDISRFIDVEMPLSELRRSHLNDMIVKMRKHGLAHNSISSYVRVLTTFLNWCDSEGYCHVSPPPFKQKETVKETYTDDELLALLARPDSSCRFTVYRNWVIINFLINSGCRAASVRSIQNRDVYLDDQQVILRHNKNGKIQTIPLCQQMKSILQEYQRIRRGKPEDFLFCDEFGGQLTESALRQGIARYNLSRGVEKTSLHLFRHTFARKYLIDCGGNAFTLQHLLGHSTLKMTQHYCRVFDADIAKSYESFSPLAQITQKKTRIRMK